MGEINMNQDIYNLRRDVDKLQNKADELGFDYFLQVNSPIVVYKNNVFTPTTLTVTAYKSSAEITDFFDSTIDIWSSTDDGVNYTFIKKEEDTHTLTYTLSNNAITNLRVNLYDAKDNLLDRQTISIVKSVDGVDGEDAVTVMLGNEAQLIPVDKNGALKTSPLTITIPVYSYKGTSRTPATIDLSQISNTFSSKTKTDPTSSNDGSITLTCTSTPSSITGNETILITVGNTTYTEIFTWSKNDDGDDGEGYQTVYCYTQKDETPTAPTSSTTIYVTPSPDYEHYGNYDIPWEADKWYNAPITPSEERRYVWQSKRMYLNNAWGNYQTPTKYTYHASDGANGIDGKNGRDGIDGNEITGDEIMTKIAGQNIDAQSIGGIPFEQIMTTNLMATDPIYDSNNHGSYTVSKLGRLCILNITNYQWTLDSGSGGTQSNYRTVFALPIWAYPLSTMYLKSVEGYNMSISSGGNFRMQTVNMTVGTQVQLTGAFVYIAQDNSNLKDTRITFDNSSVTYGSQVTVTLERKDESDNWVVFTNASVEFEVSNQVYTRQTNSNGKASLTLNLDARTYSVTARFRKDTVNAPCSTSQNVTVSAVSDPTITFSTNKATLTKNSVNLGNVRCIVMVNNTTTYEVYSDWSGVIDLRNILAKYKGSISVKITTSDTNKCSTKSATATLTGTKTIEEKTETLTLSNVGGQLNTNYNEKNGTKWNYATVGSLTYKNDGAYAITDILSNNSTAGELEVFFNIDSTKMPTSAYIKKVIVYVRYASLKGWVNASKGSYIAGQSKIKLLRDDGTTGGSEQNFVYTTLNQAQCGSWYEIGYSWDVNETNTNSNWNNPSVWISGIKNNGGGYGNNARFGIDYVSMIIEYEA